MSSSFLELIKARRSVKAYLPKEIPEAIILRIFEAAIWAPSAHNAQPWRFIVITDHDTRRKLAEAMAEVWAEDLTRDGVSVDIRRSLVESSIERFTEAPMLIIACTTMEEMDRYPDERRQRLEHLMATQSLAAAIQNILLAAHSEGLSSCWFCAPLFCQDVARKVLGIPRDVEPQALITLGYPSEQPDPPPRKPLEEVIFRNRWGERF
ncbi:MAG: nitroreductase family protein [Candidatus Bathyarchaeia archaeon]